MLLVEPLRGGQRAAGGEAEARVGLALQRREVVQQRRALLLRRLLELGDLARAGRARRRRSPRPPRRSSAAAARPRGSGPTYARPGRRRSARTSRRRASTAPGLNARISSSRRAMIASVGVCTRPSETAPSNEERSRIVAARVAFMPTIQSASERDRAASSSSVELRRRAAARRTRSLIALGRHRGQPQPLDGLLRARLLVRPGEDQLALAPGVAGVDDLVDVVALEHARDDGHLLARALVAHDELEAVRHDRQIGHPPLLVLGVVLVGLGELHEVADRPRDDVRVGLEVALVLGERARAGPRVRSRPTDGFSAMTSVLPIGRGRVALPGCSGRRCAGADRRPRRARRARSRDDRVGHAEAAARAADVVAAKTVVDHPPVAVDHRPAGVAGAHRAAQRRDRAPHRARGRRRPG